MFTKRQPLASKAQVAEYLGVCIKTIDRKIEAGELLATKIGSRVRIRWPDVDALLAKGKTCGAEASTNVLI